MNDMVQAYLKELSLPNRLEILKLLREKPQNIAGIQRELESNGRCVPVSTVSRCVNILANNKVVKKSEDGIFSLTGLGYLIVDFISFFNEISPLYEYLWDADDFLRVLPREFKIGLPKLKRAEVEPDPYAAIIKGVEVIKRAKNYGKYIDRIISYEIYQVMLKKNLEGVSEKVISSRDTLKRRIETFLKVIEDENLSKEEVELVKSKVEIRVLDLPFQLGVIDGKYVFFQLLKEKSEVPVFLSNDGELVMWAERLFDYFWNIAEPFDIASVIDSTFKSR